MVTRTAATTELVDLGEKRDRLGRKITPAERRAELVAAWRQSGLTQAAFARHEGVNYTTFASWVQEERKNGRRAAAPPPRPNRRVPAVRFVEACLPGPPPVGPLEVRLADGTVVRGGSAVELAALVRALRG